MIEDKVNEALKLRPNHLAYLEALVQIANEHPDEASVLHLLSHAQWQGNLLLYALGTCRHLVVLNPRDESASLKLFHVLWQLGSYSEAVAEMHRFQDLSNSDDYDQFEQWMQDWRNKRMHYDYSNLQEKDNDCSPTPTSKPSLP